MTETVELVEQLIVPTSEPRTMTVQSPNGLIVTAPLEAWIWGLMYLLPEPMRGALCQIVQQGPPAAPGQPSLADVRKGT